MTANVRNESASASPKGAAKPFAIGGVAALAILFVAFALRVYRLDAVGLEGDEAFSVKAAYSGLSDIVHLVSTTDPHPPLYYSLLHGWCLLAGSSEFAVRFPSVVANVLTIVFVVKLADFYSWRYAGLVGAILLALNPYQVWYSQEARVYAPVALFGIVAVYYALLFLRKDKALHLGLYGVFILLSMYSHYYAGFLFVFVNLLLLSAMWDKTTRRPTLLRWLGAQAIIGVLYFPWLVYARDMALSYTPFKRGTVDLLAIVKESLVSYSLGLSMPQSTGFILSLGFLAIVIAGLIFAGRSAGIRPAWFIYSFAVGYLLTPITLGFLVSLFRPLFQARYVMVSAPAFYLVLGLGVVGLYTRARPLGVAAGLFVVCTQAYSLHNYFYDYTYAKTDFPKAITYIENHLQPGDAILLDGWSQTLQFWYYYTLRAKQPAPSYLFPLAEPNRWDVTPERLDEIMARHRGVWLLDYDVLSDDPERRVESYLAKNYYQALYKRVELNRVVYYASGPEAAPNTTPLSISCGQDAILKSLSISSTSVRPGELLPLAIDWQATSEKPRDYAVSWRLLDSSGRIVLQRDSEPDSGFWPTSTWTRGQEVIDRYAMPIPTFLPPGQYSLAIVPYDKASGAPCEVRQGDDAPPVDIVQSARVQVLDAPPAGAIDEPSPSNTSHFAFGELNLLGYDLYGQSFKPGDSIVARLFWQAAKDVGQNYELTARLLTDKGEVVQEKRSGVGPPWFPTSQWRAGRMIATYVDVPVPPRTSSGTYRLSIVMRADGVGENTFSGFPEITVISRERTFQIPPITYPTRVDFGGIVELLGYDLQPGPNEVLTAGQEVKLTLYWKALREVPDSYKVFTQLLGEDQKIYAQHDSVPLNGEAPTSSWVQGEVLEDSYKMTVRPEASTGKYRMVVGLYDPTKGNRVPLADGSGDAFVVASFLVNSPGVRP